MNWLWAAIDERRQQWWDCKWDVLKDAIGGAMGTIRKQVRDELKRAIEEQQRSFEAKLAEQKECHDGRIEASLARERDATGGAQTQLREEVKRAIAELCDVFGAQLAEQKEHFLSVPGKLPIAKLWQPDSVIYEAQVVCHDGSLWQACKDSAQTPGVGSDFVCVARAGRDAVTPSVRGTYDAHKTYARLDIIEYDGAGYSCAAMLRGSQEFLMVGSRCVEPAAADLPVLPDRVARRVSAARAVKTLRRS